MNNRLSVSYPEAEPLGNKVPKVEIESYRVPLKVRDGNRAFNISFADGRETETDPTIISWMPFDARMDPFYARQMAHLASVRSALVIVPDTPDITMNQQNPGQTTGDRRPFNETLQSFLGNYDPLIRHQLAGIDSLLDLPDDSRIELRGPSQGGAMAASALGVLLRGEHSKSHTVSFVDIIDPVNARSGKIGPMLTALRNLITVEAALMKEYVAENIALGHSDIMPFEDASAENAKILRDLKRRQAVHTLLAGAGLRVGIDRTLIKLLGDPATSEAAKSVRITFFRGADSTVSHARDIEAAINAINGLGGNAEGVELFDATSKVGHHFWQALGRSGVLDRILKESRDDYYASLSTRPLYLAQA